MDDLHGAFKSENIACPESVSVILLFYDAINYPSGKFKKKIIIAL